jgi:transposase InsO family protein
VLGRDLPPQRDPRIVLLLFAVIDLYSRKLVAWEVHERESGDEAAILIERACWREHLYGRPLILHADNGAAQRAYTLEAKLEALGITPSHSRPGASDDNSHIESRFRTVKYMPGYPATGSGSIGAAREWVHRFVIWYNTEHYHSAIVLVTPPAAHRRFSRSANTFMPLRPIGIHCAAASYPSLAGPRSRVAQSTDAPASNGYENQGSK